MSDEHSGLSHDLPEYVPNWPLPVKKVKAQVYRYPTGGWGWGHRCPKNGAIVAIGKPKTTQAEAFAAALKHVQGCW